MALRRAAAAPRGATAAALLLGGGAVAAAWPANDSSCHTGRGRIFGMHFSGFEIEAVDAKNYGECCAACGAQQTSPKPGQKKCSWIEWNPNIPQPQCTLKTGQGNVAGQHNGIISGAHGVGSAPVFYKCTITNGIGICALPPNGTNASATGANYTKKADCDAACVAPPPPPPPPLATNPCLRFGHTIPVDHHVDVEIEQEGTVHSWTDYKFGCAFPLGREASFRSGGN